MTNIQAHGHFFNAGSDDELMQIDPQWLHAAYCTAFASLSGMLADCDEYDDLKDAVRHGQSLVTAGVVGDDDVLAEVKEVVGDVFRWAEAAAAN
jgi:hypothetical protein